MKLQLISTKITEVDLKSLDKKDVSIKKKFGLNVSSIFSKVNKKRFAIVFKINLDNPEFKLAVTSTHWFEAEKPFSEEFKLSDFININAPAIAFPFLRAYISNLTLQSGFEPAILPSMNFVEMAKKNLKSTKSSAKSK